MAHYCTHLCHQRTILHSITAVFRSRELCQASILLVFLTPRQALSFHPRQHMVWLYKLQDRDSIHIWYTILQHFTHNEIECPTAACRWYFALQDVSPKQSCHLSTPSNNWVPPGVTMLSASSVGTLVFIEMKYRRPPDLSVILKQLGLQG